MIQITVICPIGHTSVLGQEGDGDFYIGWVYLKEAHIDWRLLKQHVKEE